MMAETTRAEHMAWCKQRALAEVEAGNLPGAMASPRHLAGVTAATSWEVQCADKGVRHTGPFRDRGRAQHWRQQADAVCCSSVPHEVVPVVTARAVQP